MEIKNELDRQFFLEMNNASDRAAAIATTAYLEDKLRDLIEAYLRPDKASANRLLKPTGPLGGLQNKAELAYLLNLYTAGTRDDIRLIGEIRNKFAHFAVPITFGHQVIRDDCQKIGIFERIFKTPPDAGIAKDIAKPWPRDFAKFFFISSVDLLCGHLLAMTRNPDHPKMVF